MPMYSPFAAVRPNRFVLAAALLTFVMAPSCAAPGSRQVAGLSSARSAAPPREITGFDTPLLFTYGTWQDKIKVEGGQIHLRGDGVTPKGGGGSNADLNFKGAEDYSPRLRVKVGSANTLKMLRLMLRDASGKSAIYDFLLPMPGDFAEVTPLEGASLAKPNRVEKEGMPDLSRITQWQIQGDWGGDGAVDIDVDFITIAAPDAVTLAAREGKEKQQADERARQRQEQAARQDRYKPGVPSAPRITSLSLVAPDIISVAIDAQHVVPSRLMPYVAQPGDTQKKDGGDTKLVRSGQEVGWLIGPKKDTLVTYEGLTGDPLNEFLLSEAARYTVTSPNDLAFGMATAPTAVYRKSKPLNWQQPGGGFAMRHLVYLRLPHAVTVGKTYQVRIADVNVRVPTVTLRFDPQTVRSEAIHVNQVGFRPDDPVKRAFLSVWLGTGGAYTYIKPLPFSLVDVKSGKSAFKGTTQLASRATDPDKMHRAENFNKTDVWRLDFSGLKTPGTYRVVVDGVGCSYPFTIGAKTWETAFRTQMRGLYNNRSGIPLKPPFADFVKPRDFHPKDGAPVFQSTYTILDGPAEGAGIEKGSTGEIVPEAWGGYHDAGDWNPRRVTHMKVTAAQLELLELYPAYFSAMRLPIPHTPGVPDVLSEALFEIDCFRRLQLPDGGVRSGIETNGDPLGGEVSWKQSMPAYVYGPDPYSSWYYASVAGRAAKLLKAFQPRLARAYEQSARRAMEWAEADYKKREAAGTAAKLPWEAGDARNLASVVLYDLTGAARWHDLFKKTTVLSAPDANLYQWGKAVQRDGAFYYARLPKSRVDSAMQVRAVKGLEAMAQASLAYAAGNTFNLTTPDRGKPMIVGFFSGPDAIELARAHFLTGKPEYLAGVVQACQFGMGGNPSNMTYTTGLGANPPRNPLHMDTRHTGQPAPTGLTVYGNFDVIGFNQQWATWPLTFFLNRACTPPASEWPLAEQYFDVYLYPATNEFTVDAWTPNVYVWGYLAARK